MEPHPEKRDTERIVILGDLKGEIMVYERLRVRELGRGGALVETRFPMHLNSLHDLRLTLGSQSIVLKGRVTHCHISEVDQDIVTYQSGLEFVEPTDPVAGVIANFLATLHSNRRSA